MTDIVKGQIGPEASYELKFEDKKLKVKAKQDGDLGGAALEVYLKADAVIDALAKAIPGHVDDTVFALIKAALP